MLFRSGFFIEPVLGYLLPSKKALDEMAYKKGKRVSVIRRLLAFMIDGVVIVLIISFGSFAVGGMYFILILYFTKGYTPGMWILRIRVVDKGGNALSLWQAVIRNGILYYGISMPFVLIGLILLERLFSKKESKNILFYEWMSNTRCVSVIQEEYCYNTVSL